MRTKALFMALAIAAVSTAKDIKTVVLTTNLDDKTVVIEYDAETGATKK